ncbi:MAG: sulfatase [Planctomycetota bacterium]
MSSNEATLRERPLAIALRGLFVAALVVGVTDGLRAWLSMRGAPVEGLLEGAPTGFAGLLLGTSATVLVWTGVLLPFALLGAVVARRAPSLALGLPLFAGGSALLFWILRVRYQSDLPVTSSSSLLLAAGCVVAAGVAAALLASVATRRRARPVVALWLAAAFTGAVFVTLENDDSAGTGRLNERNRDLPNVLFVLVDALRPDVLSIHGNDVARTPTFERLAANGVVFDRAYAQAPYTWTSFGSFFTGKYPRRHGLVKMAPGYHLPPNVTFASHLDSATRRDGVQLRPEDVAGGAFLMGALSHGSGLARGFDDICELMRGNDLIRSADHWSQFRAWTAIGSVQTKIESRLVPDLHVETARQWIRSHAGGRFCAFVHLYSTHTPYDPPEPFRSMYVDPDYEGPIQTFDVTHRRAIERGEYSPNTADRRQVYDLYMGGVSKADHDIGLLLDDLEERGILDDTLVIVTSDHGEDFGEGGRWEHNHMYRSNLRVPLVMSWGAGMPKGVRVEQPVESIDVFPTICDAMASSCPRCTGRTTSWTVARCCLSRTATRLRSGASPSPRTRPSCRSRTRTACSSSTATG